MYQLGFNADVQPVKSGNPSLHQLGLRHIFIIISGPTKCKCDTYTAFDNLQATTTLMIQTFSA